MKKRGEETALWSLIELVAAVFVGYLAVNIGVAYAKGTIYEKLNIAEDLSMQVNALISLPGNAYIINKNLHGYSVSFDDNKIEVYSQAIDPAKGTYYFPEPANFKLDARLDKPEQVVLSKINGEIRISEEIPEEIK